MAQAQARGEHLTASGAVPNSEAAGKKAGETLPLDLCRNDLAQQQWVEIPAAGGGNVPAARQEAAAAALPGGGAVLCGGYSTALPTIFLQSGRFDWRPCAYLGEVFIYRPAGGWEMLDCGGDRGLPRQGAPSAPGWRTYAQQTLDRVTGRLFLWVRSPAPALRPSLHTSRLELLPPLLRRARLQRRTAAACCPPDRAAIRTAGTRTSGSSPSLVSSPQSRSCRHGSVGWTRRLLMRRSVRRRCAFSAR